MKATTLCCIAAVFSIFLFSCNSSSYYSTYSPPQKLQPAQTYIWRDGQPVLTDSVNGVHVMVQQAQHDESKYIFDLHIENKSHVMVELNPEKYYTLQTLDNGKRMYTYTYTAEGLEDIEHKKAAAVKSNTGPALLFLPFLIVGAVVESNQVSKMSKEEKQAHDQQKTLDRIEQNQGDEEEEREAQRERDAIVGRLGEIKACVMKRHTLMPGETRDGRVFFPALTNTDSVRLILPLNDSDTIQFRYSIIR